MKKVKFLMLLTVVAFLIGGAGQALATPIFGLDDFNEFGIFNVENILRPTVVGPGPTFAFPILDPDAGGSEIMVGDIFQGILRVDNNSAPPGNLLWQADDLAPTIDSFSGYFLAQVYSITPTGNGNEVFLFFGPSTLGDPAGILTPAAGEVLALYTDNSTGFESNGTVADDLGKATDGNLWATFGFASMANYWYASATTDFSIPPGAPALASGLAGLDVINNSTNGITFVPINDPNENIFNTDVSMFFNIQVDRTATGSPQATAWDFQSNDPGTIFPTPEPASMLLLGSGLIGLAGLGRKKFLKKK